MKNPSSLSIGLLLSFLLMSIKSIYERIVNLCISSVMVFYQICHFIFLKCWKCFSFIKWKNYQSQTCHLFLYSFLLWCPCNCYRVACGLVCWEQELPLAPLRGELWEQRWGVPRQFPNTPWPEEGAVGLVARKTTLLCSNIATLKRRLCDHCTPWALSALCYTLCFSSLKNMHTHTHIYNTCIYIWCMCMLYIFIYILTHEVLKEYCKILRDRVIEHVWEIQEKHKSRTILHRITGQVTCQAKTTLQALFLLLNSFLDHHEVYGWSSAFLAALAHVRNTARLCLWLWFDYGIKLN